MPGTQRSHTPAARPPKAQVGAVPPPLALAAPGSLLNQHKHSSQGSATVVQTWGQQRRWWGQLPTGQHPWGQLLSALSLASNIDSSPEGLIHLQVSAYILYIFIFIWHLVPL